MSSKGNGVLSEKGTAGYYSQSVFRDGLVQFLHFLDMEIETQRDSETFQSQTGSKMGLEPRHYAF